MIQIQTQGMVCSSDLIENIISMKLLQHIIPSYHNNANTGRISFYIEEIPQCVICSSRRYHFLTKTNANLTDSKYIECQTEDYSDGVFHFDIPIRSLDLMTFSFGDPTTILTLKPDRSTATITYANPVVITLLRDDIDFANGDHIYIHDFIYPTSPDSADFKKTSAVLRNEFGYTITNKSSSTLFEIATVDTSLVSSLAGLQIVVFFDPHRFIFGMELECIKTKKN